MRKAAKAAAVLAALVLTGCAVLRHDAIVCGVFPEESAYEAGIPVEGDWAK